MTMKLWHCYDSRSLRALWALEEMGLKYEVEVLPFPPRFLKKDYLETNPLGTVPFFIDGDTCLTESTAICHYLVEKYQQQQLSIEVTHPEYGQFLNYLYQSDTTYTFPLALILRYKHLEQGERLNPQIVEDYSQWLFSRMRGLVQHFQTNEYLCGNKFTIADIAIGMALHFGERIGLADNYKPEIKDYLARLQARPAFKRARQIGVELDPFANLSTP
ncbi:glutathione S-transferase family protein [Thalassotalea nanhaiensis]|uniref:Glutathione S-transferase family protein n=1 Tax=Thalassotalea nanhaiensis TaxID=3065648 RepID=A0ABY9TMU7_9GAMM|nr:glutathione S-transferase family protein [Colwelliaceae bacterium SQ345]